MQTREVEPVEPKLLEGLAAVLNSSALQGFADAALREDTWERAREDPVGYFRERGINVPPQIEMAFIEHQSLKPWPRPEPDLQLVKVRCWWVWGKVDPDEDPVPPFHFCLEVPAFLIEYLRGR
jgi:hypothetical protein